MNSYLGSYYEWSKADVHRIVNDAKQKGQTGVNLLMEKNTHANELQVVKWVKEMGHEAVLEFERVVVSFGKRL